MCVDLMNEEYLFKGRVQWLMSIILATTREAEIGKITI
jgi:hypothetical protein